MPQGTDGDLKHFIYFCSAAVQWLFRADIRADEDWPHQPRPPHILSNRHRASNILVTWQETHPWNSRLRFYCEQSQQVWLLWSYSPEQVILLPVSGNAASYSTGFWTRQRSPQGCSVLPKPGQTNWLIWVLQLVEVPSKYLLLSRNNNMYIELNCLERDSIRSPEEVDDVLPLKWIGLAEKAQ